MILSRKTHEPTHPPFVFDDTHISTVTEKRHLGLILSVDCRWKTDISTILTTAWQCIGILRSLKFILNRKILERTYLNFMRPILAYADVVWDNCTNAPKKELKSIQVEPARIITGATKLCNIEHLYNETTRRSPTLATFKRSLNPIQFKPSPLFYIGDRKAQSHIFR